MPCDKHIFFQINSRNVPLKMAAKLIAKVGIALSGTAALGYGAYSVYNGRHPPEQFAWDPTKKTLAILGSGWAATSFLKDLDTENFNVYIVSPRK
jgi:NADH:ubiquinone reductase (non-electrogenic)